MRNGVRPLLADLVANDFVRAPVLLRSAEKQLMAIVSMAPGEPILYAAHPSVRLS